MRAPEFTDNANQIWFPWRNDAASQCPAYGIIRITGETTSNDQAVLTGDQPNTYGSQYSHFVNGPIPVDAASGATKSYGVCTIIGRVCAAYTVGDGTPAFGEQWGPRTGTWLLKKNTGGFMVMGNVDATAGVVIVTQQPWLRFHGVTDDAIAKDASGTVSIFYGTAAGTDSTVNMSSVYNSFADVAITKDVECVWEGDVAGVKWRLVAAEC
jgi:hypothetical protein